MRVYVNGESREVQGTPSLAELITQLDLPAARIAVELNREVVRRSEWGSTMLHDEDRIEIVHFVGGGHQGAGAGTGAGVFLRLLHATAPESRQSKIECKICACRLQSPQHHHEKISSSPVERFLRV